MSLIPRLLRKFSGNLVQEDEFKGEFPFFDVLELILKHSTGLDQLHFLQVGASDGATEDPISSMILEFGWRGTLIEPSPTALRKLKQNYRGIEGLRFEQFIVSDTRDEIELPFYEVREQYRSVSRWADQCSSLNREMVLNVLNYLAIKHPELELPTDRGDAIEEVMLPAVHIADLIDKLGIKELDFLIVDTMGHDKRILEAFPFDQIRPKVVMFEHYLMSNQDRQKLLTHVANQGYALTKYAVDTIGVQGGKSRRWNVDIW